MTLQFADQRLMTHGKVSIPCCQQMLQLMHYVVFFASSEMHPCMCTNSAMLSGNPQAPGQSS
jgi:hypothetical protein